MIYLNIHLYAHACIGYIHSDYACTCMRKPTCIERTHTPTGSLTCRHMNQYHLPGVACPSSKDEGMKMKTVSLPRYRYRNKFIYIFLAYIYICRDINQFIYINVYKLYIS